MGIILQWKVYEKDTIIFSVEGIRIGVSFLPKWYIKG